MEIRAVNPGSMMPPRGYSQLVSVSGPHKSIYIGGQNAVDKDGKLVGKGDLAAQTEQALSNIEKALAAVNGTFQNVVKLTIYLAQGCSPAVGFQVFQKKFGVLANPPVITVVFVSGFVSPDFLLEIDAIAAIEE
jgi:enamine deaminase RidA (YjgF/YER057c/UK114 family)